MIAKKFFCDKVWNGNVKRVNLEFLDIFANPSISWNQYFKSSQIYLDVDLSISMPTPSPSPLDMLEKNLSNIIFSSDILEYTQTQDIYIFQFKMVGLA